MQAFERKAVTIEEFAQIFGISVSGVRNLVKAGTIPSFRLGNCIRISRKTVEELLNGQREAYQKREAAHATR